ncbi:ribokinase [Halocella sp. SP3-1]|uniref:ribokinase n=1 Tax=Halocella sp. SP3-1 TaxID=2382161 RepID=UPI000F7616B5|nr:ribokinase [Halocella sp. SP3-1]AZO94333.1 ribokinase [Halocella sp. SP3-1]
MENILVVGSMNMDLVVNTDRVPDKGETIIGKSFEQVPGGKGANQAAAVGKLGGRVSFVSACGKDSFGDDLLSSLQDKGVDTSSVFTLDDNTGIAAITVEEDGDNRIIVVQGANASLSPEMIDQVEGKIKEAAYLLLQMEIPLATVIHTIELADFYQTRVILDPAPAQGLPREIYSKIDYLLPNSGELALLLEEYDLRDEEDKIGQLLDWGVKNILITKGSEGVTLYQKGSQQVYPTLKVKAVDTTAAGDTFAGALAFGLQKGWDIDRCISFGNRAAAISVTRAGAQSSIPSFAEVENMKGI